MTIGAMHELNETGDTKITWDSDEPDEVANARETFDRLTNPKGKGKRFAAFRVNRLGNQGERMTTFDPDAEKIVLVPQLVGG